MEVYDCVSDDDYDAWRRVRMTVVPGERSATVAEMREQDSADRLLVLASVRGTVVGSGVADRSDTAALWKLPILNRPAIRTQPHSLLSDATNLPAELICEVLVVSA